MLFLIVFTLFGNPSESFASSSSSIQDIISEFESDFQHNINSICLGVPHDKLEVSGAQIDWIPVLAVYAVKFSASPENPIEISAMDDSKAEFLRNIFWDMYEISAVTESYEIEQTLLRITVTLRSTEEMADEYPFSQEQRDALAELLQPGNHDLWNELIYGTAKRKTLFRTNRSLTYIPT